MSVASRNPFDILSGTPSLLQYCAYIYISPPSLTNVLPLTPFSFHLDDAESSPSAPTPSSEKTVKDQGSNAQATKANQRGRGPASRGGRYYQRGAGAGAKPAAPREQAPEGDDAPAREGKRELFSFLIFALA